MSATGGEARHAIRRTRLRNLSIVTVASAFAFIVSGATLTQPPVWDGAMSVYPAAIELARTDFDLHRLLSLPTYTEGGPNTHSLSAWTLLVGAALGPLQSLQTLLPYLHALSFALYGLLVLAIYLIIRRSTGNGVALLGAAVAGLFPPLLVQAADVYIDLPVACLTAWAVVALLHRRYVLATLLISAAIWFKPIGVIYLPLLLAHCIRYGNSHRKLFAAPSLVVPPLIVLTLITVFGTPKGDLDTPAVRLTGAAVSTGQLLTTVPDTLGIILLALVVTFLALRRHRLIEQLEIAVFVLLGAFGFAVLNPLLTIGIPLLPRYYIGIVPIVIAGLVVQLSDASRTVGALAIAAIGLVFVVNFSGALYPYKTHATYAVAERSFAYQDLLALQKQGVALLEQVGRSRPIYFDFYRYFQFQYPEMGYTSGPPPEGVSPFHDVDMSLEIEDLPKEFALLFEYPTIGGGQLKEIWDNAIESGATVRETSLQRGSYTIYLVEIAH